MSPSGLCFPEKAMSRFFFHLRGQGLSVRDEIGTECRNADEARTFAIRVAEDLRRADSGNYPLCARLDVEDDESRPVFLVPLRLSVSER
ncbi:hypothetical protein E2493_16145 [Sphingomonas parva]|uniref:DUF6894 domain-containing protein n=1 Tax=Sphingomonas parva TaxID=2555898 RepID=A0A4Y8ZMQ2_9SPHN|nr:hypothetical protein [Sphingomonas parva]TFI57234.1 hypothetical protein E2493_16145 [Sphingomonas parva]